MATTVTYPRRLLSWVALALVIGLTWTLPAQAVVTQPNATHDIMPQPVPLSEINNVVVPRGFPPDAVTLEGLFKYRNEMLDPKADARTEPGVFSPLCGFTGEFVLHGGGCKMVFGWYNATEPPTRPLDAEIYQLVPADPTLPPLSCKDGDFCPLATTLNTQPGQHTWVPSVFRADAIAADPRYKGGKVGFALVGAPGTQCSQTKYSQAELNVQCSSCTPAAPWITTLVYQSTATPDGFYLAFEDLPMSPADWRRNDSGAGCDGDFQDFVYFITGLTCDGGGEPCTTALQGACSVGRTDCSVGGVPGACHPIVQPNKESCDNIDNDCNGIVDDGDLCPTGQVCDRGMCVGACGRGEFQCPGGTSCDTRGFCIDPLCLNVDCGVDKACRGGNCVSPCDGVVCPTGQSCALGRCVDPCSGVTCPEGRYCDRGVCLAGCQCRACATGETCAADGRCIDTACNNIQCGAGLICKLGTCINPCLNVVCPGGAQCVNGVCGDPMPGQGTGGGSTGPGPIGAGGGIVVGQGGTSQGSGADGPSLAPGRKVTAPGCACRTAPSSAGSSGLAAALAGLGFAFAAGRRRRRTLRSR